MNIPTSDLRRFLSQKFNDSELTNFCFDYFPQVQQQFTLGMTLDQKIQLLLAYCRRQGQLSHLLRALERERPQQTRSQLDHLLVGAPQPPSQQTTTQPNPRQIFVSHARQDAIFAQRLAGDLREAGWETWIAPDSIQPGEKFDEAIERGLLTCGIFLVVLSPAAIASKWVRDETNAALRRHRQNQMRFISLWHKPCEVPPLWSSYQHIAFDADYEASWRMLLRWLDPTLVAPPPSRQERERQAVQRDAARLYERLQTAVQAEDWVEVLHLGGQIQAMTGEYQDVWRLVSLARHKLQTLSAQPNRKATDTDNPNSQRTKDTTSAKLNLWLGVLITIFLGGMCWILYIVVTSIG